MVCEDLSSPTSVISEGELAVIVPVSRLPSRIKTVACGASAAGEPLFEQEERSPTSRTSGTERAKIRGMWFLKFKILRPTEVLQLRTFCARRWLVPRRVHVCRLGLSFHRISLKRRIIEAWPE